MYYFYRKCPRITGSSSNIHLFLCSFDQMSYEALKFSRRTNKISSFAWMWNMRWNNRILYISFAMMSRFIEQHQWQITGHIDDNIEAVIKWKWQKFGLKREQLAHSANKVSTMEVPDIRRRMKVILYCVRQFWDTNKAERVDFWHFAISGHVQIVRSQFPITAFSQRRVVFPRDILWIRCLVKLGLMFYHHSCENCNPSVH